MLLRACAAAMGDISMGLVTRPVRLLAFGLAVVALIGGCAAAPTPVPSVGGPAGGAPSSSPGSAANPANGSSPSSTASGLPTATASIAATAVPLVAPTAASKASTKDAPPPPPAPSKDLILYRTPVAGSRNGQYWLVHGITYGDTGNRKLALGAYAHWNADGSAVEVVSYNSSCVPTLAIYPVNGTGHTAVVIPFSAGDDAFAWTPDGTKLSFYRRSGGYLCGGTNLNYTSDLYVVNADGTGLKDIAPGLPQAEPLSWTPDGSAVVINRKLAALSGTPGSSKAGPIERINVSTKAVTQILPAATYSGVYVSPNGKLLAYLVYSGSQWRTHIIDVRGVSPAGKYTIGWYVDQDFGVAGDQDGSANWGTADLAVLRKVTPSGGTPYVECDAYDSTKPTAIPYPCGYPLVSSGDGQASIASDDTYFAVLHDDNWNTGKSADIHIYLVFVDKFYEVAGVTAGADWLAWQPAA
jgi:hypothetical protein